MHEELQAYRSSLLQPAIRELQSTQQAVRNHRDSATRCAERNARCAREVARAAEHAYAAARGRAWVAKQANEVTRTGLLLPTLLSEWYEYAAIVDTERRVRAQCAAAVRAAEDAWRRVGKAREAVTRVDEALRELMR